VGLWIINLKHLTVSQLGLLIIGAIKLSGLGHIARNLNTPVQIRAVPYLETFKKLKHLR